MKKYLLLLAGVILFVPLLAVYAETAPQDQVDTAKDGEQVSNLNIEIVSDTNIRKATIVNQGVNVYAVGFDIVNEWNKTQPGIKYALELYRTTKNNEGLVDKVVFDEVLSLTPGQSVHKDLVYNIPESLPGNENYEMQLVLSSEEGMTLAMTDAGVLKKEDNQAGIFIDPAQCQLQIGDSKYTTIQGVDLAQDEKLELVCENVTNQGKADIESSAYFVTKKRTSFGAVVSQGEMGQKEFFHAGEKKNISYTIDKAVVAQAYEGRFSLRFDGKDISNGVIFRYVIQGEAATIKIATTDKDYYTNGDTAKVSVLTSGNASAFPGARDTKAIENMMNSNDLILKLNIVDIANQMCSGESVTTFSSFGKNVQVEIPITADCQDPTVLAKIQNKNGTVLDQANFVVKTVSERSATKPGVGDVSAKIIAIRIAKILIILMPFIVVAIYLIRKRAYKNKGGIRIFLGFVILGGGLLLQVSFADAAAFTSGSYQCFIYNGGPGYCTVNGTYDAAAGTSCSNSVASASMTWDACSNITVQANLYINGSNVWSDNEGGGLADIAWVSRSSGLKTLNLGNLSVGPHTVPFRITFYHDWHDWNFNRKTEVINASKTIVVGNCPPINGACAATHYNCAVGVLDGPVEYWDQYQWWCNGSNGGTRVLCAQAKPINGVCAATHYNCAAGSLSDTAEYPDAYHWWCNGTNGGSNVPCGEFKPTPINGVCGPNAKTYAASDTDWVTRNAGFCSTGAGIVGGQPAGFINPGDSYSWTCAGLNGGGSASCSASRQAYPLPTLTLSAAPNPVAYNTPTTVAWSTVNATSCWGSNAWNGWVGPVAGGTWMSGNLTSPVTYTVECWNAGGQSTGQKSVTVGVNPLPLPIVTLAAAPNPVAYNTPTTVSWSTSNASSCWSNWGNWVSSTGGTSTSGNLTSPVTYTVECWNAGGQSTGQKSVTAGVTLPPPPTKPTLVGPTTGFVNTAYNFTATATDAAGFNIQYKFDWNNNGVPDQSTGFVASGVSQTLPYTWSLAGVKSLKVEACDTLGSCSAWSNVSTITISNCVADLNPAWSDCSSNCGTDGTQNRTLLYADCHTENQSQNCNRVDCPQWREVIP